MNILMVAPHAPPKNSPEAIQVRRVLAEFDRKAEGTLITAIIDSRGTWGRRDESLTLKLAHFDTQVLALPWHEVVGRVLMSHRLARWQVPDAWRWMTFLSGSVIRRLNKKPDVIYSRSSPMSAALLARKLKRRLGVPWIMHLSDPWADSPYKNAHPAEQRMEAACFAEADYITLTTEGQAAHYRRKYPALAEKIGVCPNTMPEPEEWQPLVQGVEAPQGEAPVRIVFAGSLYGQRSPRPLVEALQQLDTETLSALRVDIYGNAQGEALEWMQRAPEALRYHGPIPFAQACREQYAADIALIIEPEDPHPLGQHFLPSKTLESLALGRRMLAITPLSSETGRICAQGYGWVVSPSDVAGLADRLKQMVATRQEWRREGMPSAPEHFRAPVIAQELLEKMQRLVTNKP